MSWRIWSQSPAQELILLIQRNPKDEDSFSRLVGQMDSTVRAWKPAHGLSREDLDDVMISFWLSVHRDLSAPGKFTFMGEGQFRVWLRRKLIWLVGRQYKKQTDTLDVVLVLSLDQPLAPGDDSGTTLGDVFPAPPMADYVDLSEREMVAQAGANVLKGAELQLLTCLMKQTPLPPWSKTMLYATTSRLMDKVPLIRAEVDRIKRELRGDLLK